MPSSETSLPYAEAMIIFILLAITSLLFGACLSIFCSSLSTSAIPYPLWVDKSIFKPLLKPIHQCDCGFAVFGILALVAGHSTLAVWASQMDLVQQFEYFGPIQVMSYQSTINLRDLRYSYKYDCRMVRYDCSSDSNNKKTCEREECETGYYEGVEVSLTAGWGGSWGCPLDASKSCTDSSIALDSCGRKICDAQTESTGEVCSQEQRAAATSGGDACALALVNGGVDFPPVPVFDSRKTPEDPTAGERIYMDAHADCDACDVLFALPTEEAKRNGLAGAIVLGIGYVVWFLTILRNGMLGVLFGWGERPKPIWMDLANAEAYVRPGKFREKWGLSVEHGANVKPYISFSTLRPQKQVFPNAGPYVAQPPVFGAQPLPQPMVAPMQQQMVMMGQPPQLHMPTSFAGVHQLGQQLGQLQQINYQRHQQDMQMQQQMAGMNPAMQQQMMMQQQQMQMQQMMMQQTQPQQQMQMQQVMMQQTQPQQQMQMQMQPGFVYPAQPQPAFAYPVSSAPANFGQ